MTLPEILALEPAQVRVLVAEKCGVNIVHARFWHLSHGGFKWWECKTIVDAESLHLHFGTKEHPVQEFTNVNWLPDYTGDLNCIAQAVAGLTDEEYEKYGAALAELVVPIDDGSHSRQKTLKAGRALIEATALQRARAFLVGKSE